MIYLDNAATTKTAPEVVEAMLPYFSELYGNPSSVYQFSQKSKEAIAASRETIAGALGAKPEEIYFTAGGTEADNWYQSGGGSIPCEGQSYYHVEDRTSRGAAYLPVAGKARV